MSVSPERTPVYSGQTSLPSQVPSASLPSLSPGQSGTGPTFTGGIIVHPSYAGGTGTNTPSSVPATGDTNSKLYLWVTLAISIAVMAVTLVGRKKSNKA